MFEKFWNKRTKANPGEPKYISLCYILEGSGEGAAEIYEIFDEYMDKKDFLPSEREEMVLYLVDIAQDRN
jgi:hypothetical protein